MALVSARMTDKQAERLYELSAGTGDISLSAVELIKRNQEFHVAVAQVTGSPRIVAAIRRILDESTRIFHLGLGTFAEHGMRPDHDRLIDALREGNLQTAMEVCKREAYDSSERVVANLLQSPWATSVPVIGRNGIASG
jgi:DNA-binding GntR family transcriptional regulator